MRGAVWAPVIAAVGASGLTVLGSFWINHWQTGRREASQLASARRAAYARLLAVTGLMVHSGWMLRVTMEMRSGLAEGVDVALHLRKPIEGSDVDNWLRRDLEPLYAAWSEVWTIGSAQGVAVANDIVDCVGALIGGATNRGESRSGLAARLLGEKWTDEQVRQWLEVADVLGEKRRYLAALARDEVGLEVADFVAEAS